jgi:hypothetical protein
MAKPNLTCPSSRTPPPIHRERIEGISNNVKRRSRAHRKMSFSISAGGSKYADVAGFVIPFHRILFHIASEDRQLAGWEIEQSYNTQWRDTRYVSSTFSFFCLHC